MLNEVLSVKSCSFHDCWLNELCYRKFVKENVDCTESVKQFTSEGKRFWKWVKCSCVCLQRRKPLCCDELILLISTYGYMWWLVKTVSTRYSEIGSHCNEQTRVKICTLAGWDREHSLQRDWLLLQRVSSDCWLSDIEVCYCSELGCRYSEHEICCSETFTRCSEWSLHCDNVRYNVNVELLCWYINVCLVRSDSYENVRYVVHVGTLAQAYKWGIANKSLSCDMKPKYWVICEMNWLIATPRHCVARDWVLW